jgi:hypothetical protein
VAQQSALQPHSSLPQLPAQHPSSQQPKATHSSPQQPEAAHAAVVQQSADAAAFEAITGTAERLASVTSVEAAAPHSSSQQAASQPQSSLPQLPAQQLSSQQPRAAHPSPQSAQQAEAAKPAASNFAPLIAATACRSFSQHAAPFVQQASWARQQSAGAWTSSFAMQHDFVAVPSRDATFASLSPTKPATANNAVVTSERLETPRSFTNIEILPF